MNPDRPVFSLKAFLLAPIPVPLGCSAFFAAGMTKPVGLFLMSFTFGLIVSCLGTTALVASLWLIAQARPVTKTVTAFAGLILGVIGYLPMAYVIHHSSGDNSGPPSGTFGGYLLHQGNDFPLYIFLGGGLVTALLYDFIATRSSPRRQETASEILRS